MISVAFSHFFPQASTTIAQGHDASINKERLFQPDTIVPEIVREKEKRLDRDCNSTVSCASPGERSPSLLLFCCLPWGFVFTLAQDKAEVSRMLQITASHTTAVPTSQVTAYYFSSSWKSCKVEKKYATVCSLQLFRIVSWHVPWHSHLCNCFYK